MLRNNQTLIDALRRTALFAELAEPELAFLAERAHLRRYARNEFLFAERDTCKGLFVVATGLIRIFKTSVGGREHVLSVEGPGSSFAELPIFDGEPYPASAMASLDSEVVFISQEHFRALCLQHPEVALRVLKVVSKRLRHLVGLIEELSFATVRQRLIRYLLRKARSGPTFLLEANYQSIASEIGTVRDLVSRNLARLQMEGALSISGREITILEIAKLESELTHQ